MTKKVRLGIAGVLLVATIGLVSMSGPSYAGGDKDLAETVKKIGATIGKGDATGATKAATTAAKKIEETSDLMHLYRPRSKGGLGWGSKAGTNPATDGLEKKIEELKKAVPATFFKDKANNEEAINWMGALVELTLAKTPAKDMSGGKTKKAWIDYTEKLRSANTEFAKAVAGAKADDVKKAAAKINTACVDCHSKFKE